MNDKYELIKENPLLVETESNISITCYRIRALKDFGNVKIGDIGGLVQGYENLSQKGNSWIDMSSKVLGKSIVTDNAIIKDSYLYNHVIVEGNSTVINSILNGLISIKDNASVIDLRLYSITLSEIFGNCVINHVYCDGSCYIGYNANVRNANISGSIYIYDNVIINYVMFYGRIILRDNVKIGHPVNVRPFSISIAGNLRLNGNSIISNNKDFFQFTNNWSNIGNFVYTKSDNKWHKGCFYGTSKELLEKARCDDEIEFKQTGKSFEKEKNYKYYVDFVEQVLNK